MAKKVKKPTRKPKKKGSSKKKKSNNIITKVIVVIFVLILAFFLISKVFRPVVKTQTTEKPTSQLNTTEAEPAKKTKSEEKTRLTNKVDEKTEKKDAETTAVERSITGIWKSTTGGAILTMGDNKYSLDVMGIDADNAITGTYIVEGNLITFTNKKDPCKDVKGLYEVKFDNNEIGFKYKSDDCTKRKATIPTEWEWLDTEE